MSEDPATETLKRFRIIYGAVRKHSQNIEKACGVGGAQIWVLDNLARHPGMRVTQLARAMSIHPSTASNLLDKLERAGLLRRQRNSDDQRVVELYLTDAGQAVLDRAPQPLAGVLSHALGQLPSEVLLRLNDDLQAVIQHLRSADEAAASEPLSEL